MNAVLVKSNLSYILKKYFAITKVWYLHNTTYWFDVVSLGIMVALRLWVFYHLYILAFMAVGSDVINGLSFTQTIWILAFTQILSLASSPDPIIRDITEEIRSGKIEYTINKPYSYFGYVYFGALGRLWARFLTTLCLSSIAAWWFVGFFQFSLNSFMAAILLAFLGFSINVIIAFIIGLSAFWTEDTSAARWIYNKLYWYFGGLLLPISFFPDTLKKITELSPFGQLFYSASYTLVSSDLSVVVKYVSIQLFWILILGFLGSYMLKKITKDISING